MDPAPPLANPAPLDPAHDNGPFDCGAGPLDDHLKKHALRNNQNRSARTYVAARGVRVVGYYTLAAGSVGRADAPPRVTAGLGRYPVPAILLARLAVDVTEQGKGFGRGLLKDALLRVSQSEDIAGFRAVLVHAKDAAAKAIYERHGCWPSPAPAPCTCTC